MGKPHPGLTCSILLACVRLGGRKLPDRGMAISVTMAGTEMEFDGSESWPEVRHSP